MLLVVTAASQLSGYTVHHTCAGDGYGPQVEWSVVALEHRTPFAAVKGVV
jgi:hypothetical protein